MSIPQIMWWELDGEKIGGVQRGVCLQCGNCYRYDCGGFPQLPCANAQSRIETAPKVPFFYVLWCRTCQLLADCGGGAGKEGKGSPCVTQHLRSPSRCTTYGDKRYTMIVLSSACQNFYKEW